MNIPYAKIAIYLLTFLGYIYSGYGSGLLGNLRDAILTAETVFGDVLKNAIKVAQQIGTLHDVFNAAVEEDCIFSCPADTINRDGHIAQIYVDSKDNLPVSTFQKIDKEHHTTLLTFSRPCSCISSGSNTFKRCAYPKPNRNHIPSANGCGSLGLKISSDFLPFGAMEKCCDSHDICYDTCNKDKEVCDVDFKRCLYRHCDGYSESIGGQTMTKACKGAAKMLFTGTLTLGCKSYMDSQSKACYCSPGTGSKDKKKSKYTPGGDRSEL